MDPVLSVAEAAAETSLEGGNMALAIFIPVLIISLLLGGAYIYLTRWDIQPVWESPIGTWPGLAQHRCALAGRIPQEWVWGPSTKVCSMVPGGQGEPG